MKPTRRKGKPARRPRNIFAAFRTPWGWAALEGRGTTLEAFLLPRRSRRALLAHLKRSWPDAIPRPGAFGATRRRLLRYFAGNPVRFPEKIALPGTGAFGRKILAAARRIPWGRTVSYGEIARAAGRPGAARAAGGALGANPLPVIIPCHRVTGAGGAIGGYSGIGGRATKRRLLRLEGHVL
ncbi:MAG: methylated-DNA--[protein]-cysteine S-methyltransferase [Planctomycetota bacterium]